MNSFLTFTESINPKISNYLRQFLSDKKSKQKFTSEITAGAFEKMFESTKNGKGIRGALVFLGCTLVNPSFHTEDALKIASAMELVHTSLLIHDDIMDADEFRRKKPSLFKQYENEVVKKTTSPRHIGESLATAVGDMGFFCAFELIQKTHNASAFAKLFSEELTNVALAQMEDVYYGSTRATPTQNEILSVYTYKTGRYSIGLPLVLGATLAEGDKTSIELLWQFGEALGILYQIRDDWLSLFADEKISGKPVGGDILEGKKTLYWLMLIKHSIKHDKDTLTKIFGNKTCTKSDIAFVKECIKKYSIENEISKITKPFIDRVHETIEKLTTNETNKKLLTDFIEFVTTRTR